MRRIYTAVKQRNPQGQVNVHNSTSMLIPALGWASSYWDGEQFGKNFDRDVFAMDVLPLDAFRAEFMGHQWGVPAEFLCRGACPFNREQAYAISLLHDVLVREGYENHCELLELEAKLWRLSDEFGRKQAQWLPYWRNQEYVTVSPEGGYASLYRHPDHGVLAVVSNLGRAEATLKVRFDLPNLKLADRDLTAVDWLSNQEVELNDDTVCTHLPSMGWQVLWIR
jgi:hypothetical protein